MRTAANKARMVEVCRRCGREPAPHGCRAVAMGWFCLRDGLDQDPATIIGPSRAADPAAGDPAAKRAQSVEAKAQAAFDKAHDAWIDSVAAHQSFELKARSGPVYFSGDMSPILPETNTAEQRELRDREQEARADRDAAGRRLIEAQQDVRYAEARARRRART